MTPRKHENLVGVLLFYFTALAMSLGTRKWSKPDNEEQLFVRAYNSKLNRRIETWDDLRNVFDRYVCLEE